MHELAQGILCALVPVDAAIRGFARYPQAVGRTASCSAGIVSPTIPGCGGPGWIRALPRVKGQTVAAMTPAAAPRSASDVEPVLRLGRDVLLEPRGPQLGAAAARAAVLRRLPDAALARALQRRAGGLPDRARALARRVGRLRRRRRHQPGLPARRRHARAVLPHAHLDPGVELPGDHRRDLDRARVRLGREPARARRSRSRRASSRSRPTSRSCRRSTSRSSPRTRASRCSC